MDNPNLYLLDLHDFTTSSQNFLGKDPKSLLPLPEHIYKFHTHAQHKLTLPREKTERTSI